VTERAKGCELCVEGSDIAQTELAFARFDSDPLCAGHVIVCPRRHVADFFDLTEAEMAEILALLRRCKEIVEECYLPDGYNVGVNCGVAAGQNRMHAHVHLIPRTFWDSPDPPTGIRCVLPRS